MIIATYWLTTTYLGEPVMLRICKLKNIALPHGPFSFRMQSYGASSALLVTSKLAPFASNSNAMFVFWLRHAICLSMDEKVINFSLKVICKSVMLQIRLQWSITIHILHAEIAASLQQHHHGVNVLRQRWPVQCGVVFGIAHIGIGATVEKRTNHIRIADLRCPYHRCPAAVVRGIDKLIQLGYAGRATIVIE